MISMVMDSLSSSSETTTMVSSTHTDSQSLHLF